MNIFYCPECDKEIQPSVASFIKFWQRLDLPHFVCGKCRTVYYDKIMIRKLVSDFRKGSKSAKAVPHKVLYKKLIVFMDGLMDNYYIKELGYRFIRFRKKQSTE